MLSYPVINQIIVIWNKNEIYITFLQIIFIPKTTP